MKEINQAEQIVCIGGANVDRKFYLKDKVQFGTSNPVQSTQSSGGVARNIAENLGRLGMKATLLTSCGADSDWTFIKQASSLYMNLDYVNRAPGLSTGSYSAVLDSNGNLVIALADMEVYETISPEFIKRNKGLLSRAKCIVADLNCPKDTLQYISHFSEAHKRPLIFIPVSSPKMNRLPDNLSGVTWLMTNRDETERYLNIEIKTDEQWEQAVETWLLLGITNVIITNGKKGARIGNRVEGIFHVPSIETDHIVDVTGAGDAFSAAVIYSWLKGEKLIDIAKAGIVNAVKTLQSPYTVRQDLTVSQLEKDLEEI